MQPIDIASAEKSPHSTDADFAVSEAEIITRFLSISAHYLNASAGWLNNVNINKKVEPVRSEND